LTTPTPHEIRVALGALEADAEEWARAAEQLRAAAATAHRQALDPVAFTFAGRAAAGAYEDLRVRMAGLIAQGAVNVGAIATALRASAAAYAADEAAGVHRLQNIY
jgi:hypothetical protein